VTRPDLPLWLDGLVVELLAAAEPFAKLCDVMDAPDDGYQQCGPCRVTFGQIRRLRSAVEAIRSEWRY
jgi:hypothetical protein